MSDAIHHYREAERLLRDTLLPPSTDPLTNEQVFAGLDHAGSPEDIGNLIAGLTHAVLSQTATGVIANWSVLGSERRREWEDAFAEGDE